jgi:hypothetical protein
MSIPVAVSKPIFIRSRRLNPAAINSCRFFDAVSFSFSRLLFLLEIFAIWDSIPDAWQSSSAKLLVPD